MTIEKSRNRETRMRRAGFTLIELSIVLVIIALIVGGVLAGREIIKNAEIRSQISFLTTYGSSITTFRLKYNCLPGDCNQAVQLGLGTAGAAGRNGDGNGQVFSAPFMRSNSSQMVETLNVPYHLQMAGLLQGAFAGSTGWGNTSWNFNGYLPVSILRDASYVSAMTAAIQVNGFGTAFGGNILLLHGLYTINATTREHVISQGVEYGYALTAQEGFEIDSKIDDGMPRSGRVVEHYSNWGAHFSGSGRCNRNNNSYDVLGLFDGTISNSGETTPRPEKIDCSIAVSGLW